MQTCAPASFHRASAHHSGSRKSRTRQTLTDQENRQLMGWWAVDLLVDRIIHRDFGAPANPGSRW